MTAIAPEASKAATLTGDGELTFVSFPISKTEETPDGDLVVYGKATDGSVDSDEQIVDPEWAGKGPGGLQDWLATAGNVRVQHQAQRDPAGKGLSVEVGGEGGHWVKSLVVEPVAKELVRKGVLTAYSVGIARPEIVRDPVARGGRIKGGQIVELSLVDRPANKNCGIELVKAAGDGTPEFTGKVFGAAGMLDKAADPDDGTVNVDLPPDVSLSISPADLAKLTTFKQRLVQKGAAPSVAKASTSPASDPALAAFKAVGDAEDAILGKGSRTFSAEQRRGYASDQIALADGSYPMPDADAVRRAAILIRSKHGNWKAAARLLAKRVKALGIPNPLKKKPERREDRHPGRRQVRLQRRDDGRQALHHVQGREADGQACHEGHRARGSQGEGQAPRPVPRLRRQAEPQA